jgi:hypothetical protein
VYYCVTLDLFCTEQEGEYVHDVNAMLDDDMGVHVTDDVIDDVVNGDDSEAELDDDDAYGNGNNKNQKPKDEQGSSGEGYLRSVLLRLIYRCVTARHTTTDTFTQSLLYLSYSLLMAKASADRVVCRPSFSLAC